MGLLKKTPEELAEKAEAKREKQLKKAMDAFWASPPGLARTAFENEDHVFQYSIDVVDQTAWTGGLIGTRATRRQADPSAIINAVCDEGWELVNGDFVFLMTGQQSRDYLLSSGQNTAVRGTVMGYYLFRRCEDNRLADSDQDLLERLRIESERF